MQKDRNDGIQDGKERNVTAQLSHWVPTSCTTGSSSTFSKMEKSSCNSLFEDGQGGEEKEAGGQK